MCCGKEATLLKSTLTGIPGIMSVTVNIVGRTAFVTHTVDLISATEIIDKLNELHLGVSIIANGDNSTKAKYDKKGILINVKIVNIIVMGCLLVTLVVTHVKHYAFEKWIAIPILILGGIPMIYKALIDFKRYIFLNLNVLMMVAVGGAISLNDWIDACLIVFVFDIAEYVENASRYKVEKYIGGKFYFSSSFLFFSIFLSYFFYFSLSLISLIFPSLIFQKHCKQLVGVGGGRGRSE